MDMYEQLEAIKEHRDFFSLDNELLGISEYLVKLFSELSDKFELFVYEGGVQFEWENDKYYIEFEVEDGVITFSAYDIDEEGKYTINYMTVLSKEEVGNTLLNFIKEEDIIL